MRNIQLLTLVIPALLLSVAPVAAQCHMQYSVSVYADGSVSGDLSTVYGSSNFVDHSTLCGATHSNYQSITTIYPPSGPSVQNKQSGVESNAQIATYGVLGTYEVAAGDELYCSAAEENIECGDGGPEYPVAVATTVSLTVGASSCTTLHLQNYTCNFVVGAYAGSGFENTVSGTITVSAPENPNSVSLSNGSGGQDYPFSLSAGGTTNGTCNQPSSFCFVVTTSSSNTKTGPLSYGVTLNNSPNGAYTIPGGFQTKTVSFTVVQ